MKNQRNILVGLTAALCESYGEKTPLCEFKKNEFTTGGTVSNVLKHLDFIDGANAVISQRNWWTLTALEFQTEVLAEFDNLQKA